MSRFHRRGGVWLVACLGLALGLAGCGPGTSNTSLTGVVKLNGTPVPGGEIQMYPQEGSDKGMRTTLITTDGHYRFAPPVPVGAAKFTVKGPSGQASSPSAPVQTVQVPAKYMDANQSGLSYTVKEGENTHDFELTP